MLDNKNILVLGASGLLGKEIVNAILLNNSSVIAVDINLNPKEKKLNVEYLDIDVTNEDDVIDLFSKDINIDGVVNCTYPRNKSFGKNFYDVSMISFNDNVAMNLGSSFLIMQQCAIYFKRNKKPLSLVNIASIYGVIAPDFSIYDNTSMTMPVEYAAIKSAIIHLNKYISKYVKDSRFRVNSVSPGGIIDRQPGEFLARYKNKTHGRGMLIPDNIIGSIIFLLSDKSQYITGQNLIIDDGFTL